jgi:hypothetical protein
VRAGGRVRDAPAVRAMRSTRHAAPVLPARFRPASARRGAPACTSRGRSGRMAPAARTSAPGTFRRSVHRRAPRGSGRHETVTPAARTVSTVEGDDQEAPLEAERPHRDRVPGVLLRDRAQTPRLRPPRPARAAARRHRRRRAGDGRRLPRRLRPVNVVVVSPSPAGRAAGGRPLWVLGVLDAATEDEVTAWVRAGGPGIADPPGMLDLRVFQPARRVRAGVD